MDPTPDNAAVPAGAPTHQSAQPPQPGAGFAPNNGPGGASGSHSTDASAKAHADSVNAEIDEAMAALGLGPAAPKGGGGGGGGGKRNKQQPAAAAAHHNVTPIGGPAKPKLHGPRVVQAGREHRSGTVVSVGPTDIFIEFGPKELGVASRIQWPDDQLPAVGSELEVVVDRYETAESIFICSRPGTVQKADWEMLEVGQVIEARVSGVNKGGLELEVAGHRAFMPASQVGLERIEDLSVFVGQKFPCQVSQIDRRGKGNIVLSRRDLLDQERKEKAGKLRDTLNIGDVLDGTVRKIMPFGAFVDIGGLDGLVHVADLSYDRVGFGEGAVAKHVKEGQNVRVQILKLDWDNNRISLGMKQLLSDPFTTAVNDIKEGADVSGRITRLADFGAFVEIAPGVEGLVHVSEIAHRRINVPGDVLKPDEIVQARVLKIDPESRRISLSIKALLPAPEAKPGRGGDRGKPAGRTPEEIAKETPALRRMREQAKNKTKGKLTGGFGADLEGGGLGDLKWKG